MFGVWEDGHASVEGNPCLCACSWRTRKRTGEQLESTEKQERSSTGIKVPNLRVNLVAMQLSTTFKSASRSSKSILKESFSTSSTASSSAFMKARQITVGWMFRSRWGSACDNISPAAWMLQLVYMRLSAKRLELNRFRASEYYTCAFWEQCRWVDCWGQRNMVCCCCTCNCGQIRRANAPRIITEVVPSPTSSS